MLGAITGDIVGSVYEFRNYRATDFDPFFHPRAFYTDDTICTAAVADKAKVSQNAFKGAWRPQMKELRALLKEQDEALSEAFYEPAIGIR
jgi:ADP-ribosylglycohydrolase